MVINIYNSNKQFLPELMRKSLLELKLSETNLYKHLLNQKFIITKLRLNIKIRKELKSHIKFWMRS